MRHFPRELVTRPPANGPYAVFALTVSCFVLAHSVQFGKVSILALYAVWLVPVVVEPRILLRHVWPMLGVLGFTAFAFASTLWSDAPGTTLRAAIQYGTTVFCAIVAARILSPYGLVYGMLVGIFLILLYSLGIGRYDFDVVDRTYRFVGAFASKNQLGFFCSLGMLFALVGMMMKGVSVLHRGFALVVGILAAGVLVRTQSATSLATVVPVLAGAAGLFVAGRVAPGPRLVVVGFAALALTVLLLFALLQGDADESFLAAFGKDTTLTGRTLLWAEGLAAAAERPWFGSGYNAFWRVGHAPAEYLWEMFYITGKSGFHFHNTYIQAAVGVGIVGLALLVGTVLAGLGLAVRAALRPRVTADAVLAVALVVLLLLRSFVEIDILYPYTVGAFLFTVALLRLASPQASVVLAPAPRPIRIGYGERRIVLSARRARAAL
ncbi:O-antigen ligase [Acuticoccus sp. I52.16.1]|uniref:O-antigen ligase family protein n=1 Tax=Acuticoccus sp. I52.16.1 TaxID=2928472 RepID=UPI001FD1C631|nr:O-antigen ligase [Acuticoccus sp. I52.16.1]UOM36047.1 O-antigen ligase family protein [Acuticoccus sp. I52.16.1]